MKYHPSFSNPERKTPPAIRWKWSLLNQSFYISRIVSLRWRLLHQLLPPAPAGPGGTISIMWSTEKFIFQYLTPPPGRRFSDGTREEKRSK